MLGNKAIITLSNMKAYAQITVADQDSLLENLIDSASSAMETFCGTPLIKRQITEKKDGGKAVAILAATPVDLGAAITVKEDGIALLPSEFDPYEAGYVRRRNRQFAQGNRNVEVTYTAGRGTQTRDGQGNLTAVNIDEDLKQACRMLVQFYLKADVANYGIVFVESGATLRPDAWPRQVKALLTPYRRVTIG